MPGTFDPAARAVGHLPRRRTAEQAAGTTITGKGRRDRGQVEEESDDAEEHCCGAEEGAATEGVRRAGTDRAQRSFGGVTIPSAGRVGWFFGTDRWPGGEFFRFEITDLRLVQEDDDRATGADGPDPLSGAPRIAVADHDRCV